MFHVVAFRHRAWPKTRGPEIGLDRGRPFLQLASSSSAPRARRCGQEKVFDQLTFGTSTCMSKPAEPSLHEQCRYIFKSEATTQ